MSAEISKWFAIIADPLSSDVSKEIEKDLESRSKVAEKVTPRHELLERVSCTLNLAAYDEDDSSI
ncbi:hypothetical protein L916_16783 [Phytophthora nicotianae]|nr:hypothetical protein L916_16783 [Phytophthora nicotianae]